MHLYSLRKFFFGVLLAGLLWSCRNDSASPGVRPVYAVFNYNGAKIDSTAGMQDQVIFRNKLGVAPDPVYVPAFSGDVCLDPVYVATLEYPDTFEWHLRLVDPDGSPAHLQAYLDANNDLVLVNNSVTFYLPSTYTFPVQVKTCGNLSVIVIGE